jgi:hypothetical protein
MRRKILRITALFVAFNMLSQVIAPSVAYALTDGPNSPEFSSFEPVATTDMVNVFSGDFTYNLPVLDIPGPDGAGYSMSLSYHSGTSSEDEASWVGYGWTLNPGAINRNTRGFPDDYKKAPIEYYNKTRPNWSAGATNDIGLEIFSKDTQSAIGIKASSSLRFNNYRGYQRSIGLGLNVMGMLNLGLNYSAEGVTYSAQVNPAGILDRLTFDEAKAKEKMKKALTEAMTWKKYVNGKLNVKGAISSGISNAYGLFNFNEHSRATGMTAYTGESYNFSASLAVHPYLAPIGVQVGTSGNLNIQWMQPQTTKYASGFMNNIKITQAESADKSNEMTDYYTEKGDSYSKRDYFLGIPFNNADNFSITGEGIGGGFRFYPSETGHFYPAEVTSKTRTMQTGLEVGVGLNVSIGMDLGIGKQKLGMGKWPKQGNTAGWQFDSPNGVFRFNNDLGGEVEYSANNDAESGDLITDSNFPGFKNAHVDIPASVYKSVNNAAPVSRSSFIDYHTNSQLSSTTNAFNKTANINDLVYRSASVSEDLKSGIGEISIHTQEGNQYIYGVPTYTRNESQLQFGIKNASIYDNYIAYQDVAFMPNDLYTPDRSKHETVIGEVKKVPYATSYLLSQIISPDYVDIGTAGISEDDFGGWTQFSYHKSYGGNNQWYRYRTPYTGLFFQKGSISDTKDDVGSVTSGEKEVYYLKNIETKTHIAFFVTNKSDASRFPNGYNASYLQGSNQARLDGKGASKTLVGSNFEKAARENGSNARGDEELEYLEKIVLFSKERKDKPIVVTRFAYNYDLVGNVPNNSNGKFPQSKANVHSGKLTLEKVWFEYEGVVNSKISPYVFKYEYKDQDEFTYNNEGHLLTQFPDFAAFLSRYSKESQNPDYNPHLLDAWGYNQNFGKEQRGKDRPWIYQGPDNITSGAKSFDPAAWQLKQIKLPSGGEILVEYEQKDYRTVQDRPAMVMTSLASSNDNYSDPEYVINTKDLNVTTSAERDQLIQNILAQYGNGKEKIYFKFLYALKGNVAAPDFCKSEYIDGYANLLKAEASGALNIKITLEGKTVSGSSGLRYNSPRQACYDLVANQRLGKVDDNTGNDCTTALEEQFDSDIQKISDGSGLSPIAIRLTLVPAVIIKVHHELSGGQYQIPDKHSVCKKINNELSYLKIPALHAKKGGGIRVKTLYMLDHGLETGDAALYGTQYIYEDEDGNSSGVATNEPSTIREENPLVTFLPKKTQSLYSMITSGEATDQSEGPLGESLLPAASVGYSRVVVKNIHEGPTGTGFAIHEYFTAKDYPFDKEYKNALTDTEISGKSVTYTNLGDNTVKDHLNVPAVFFNYSVDKVWASQGFRFVINSMHGQVKTISTYGGDYKDFGTHKTYLSTAQEYTYFEPGERIKILKSDGTYSLETPGKEMDVAMESRSLFDNSMNFSVEVDISIGILAPVPPVFFGAWPSFEMSDSRMSSHTTSKVIRYPAIVKKVLSYKDGSYNLSENVAFNGATGQPLLTKSSDSFDKVLIGNEVHDGSIYSVSIPASWKYPAMGAKSENISNTNQLTASTASFVTYGAAGNLITDETNHKWSYNLTKDDNLIAAQVQTFNNSTAYPNWFSKEVTDNYPEVNGTGVKAKLGKIWRPFETFAYKTDATSSNGATEDKIYKGGFYKNFSMFNWTAASQSDPNWIKMNHVTKYSPHGSALEEKNILGIFSAVKYDYNFGLSKNLLPVMMTTNGEYRSIAFNSFETSGTATTAHAGSKSLQYASPSVTPITGLTGTPQLISKGAIVKLWLKSSLAAEPLQPEVTIGAVKARMEKVAKTGEWTLFSANIDKSAFTAAAFNVAVTYPLRQDETVFMDDVRFQPFDAESKCYVYDVSTLKLLAQFDDQHFGLFYQYNDEGKLVRKQVETEKGLKTIQETQYNTPKIGRPL